jgi:hypothetical protein
MSDSQPPRKTKEHPGGAAVSHALLHAVGWELVYRARWWEALGRNSLMTATGESVERFVVDVQSLVVICTVPPLSVSCGIRFPVSRFTGAHRGLTKPVGMSSPATGPETYLAVDLAGAAEFIEHELMEFFDTTEISTLPQIERDGYVELPGVEL